MARNDRSSGNSRPSVRRSGKRRRQDAGVAVERPSALLQGERKKSGSVGGRLIAILAAALIGGAGAVSQVDVEALLKDLLGQGSGAPVAAQSSPRSSAPANTTQQRPTATASPSSEVVRTNTRGSEARPDAPFDYYVLALSWSPAFCRDKPNSEQCGQGRRFNLHGLWPQYETGWPQDCDSKHRNPSRALLRRYADLSGSAGLLGYQWRKHGACSGLSPEAYFDTAAAAMAKIKTPTDFKRLKSDRRVDPRVLERAFVSANPDFKRDGVTIKCKDGKFSEIRICLTPSLKPRKCGRDVIRDCGARSIDLMAPR